MPMLFECVNYEFCRHYVDRPFTMCDTCKQAARELDKAMQEEQKYIRLTTIRKNDGLRRWKKP